MKYVSIFWLVLRCFLVARKENSTGFSTGLTGRSKNLDPTGRSTRLVSISARAQGARKSSGFRVKFWYRTITP